MSAPDYDNYNMQQIELIFLHSYLHTKINDIFEATVQCVTSVYVCFLQRNQG